MVAQFCRVSLYLYILTWHLMLTGQWLLCPSWQRGREQLFDDWGNTTTAPVEALLFHMSPVETAMHVFPGSKLLSGDRWVAYLILRNVWQDPTKANQSLMAWLQSLYHMQIAASSMDQFVVLLKPQESATEVSVEPEMFRWEDTNAESKLTTTQPFSDHWGEDSEAWGAVQWLKSVKIYCTEFFFIARSNPLN